MCNKMAINGLTSVTVNSSHTCHSNFGIWVMIAQGYIPIQEKSYNIYGNFTRVEIVSLNLHDFIHLNPRGIYMHSLFVIAWKQLCQKTWREKLYSKVSKYNLCINHPKQLRTIRKSANKIGKKTHGVLFQRPIVGTKCTWQQLFCFCDAYYVFLHVESRIRSNDSIPASLNAIKRTFVAIIWGIWFFFLLLELRQHHSHMEVITWFV